MAIPVEQRFHRTIKKLARATSIDQFRSDTDLSWAVERSSELGQLIGFYKDPEQGSPEVWFFERGMSSRLGHKSIASALYADIESSTVPVINDNILEASNLLLTMKNGSKLEFRFTGADGNFRDVFEVWRFILRVTEDLKAAST
jgi:hypothetical protein